MVFSYTSGDNICEERDLIVPEMEWSDQAGFKGRGCGFSCISAILCDNPGLITHNLHGKPL